MQERMKATKKNWSGYQEFGDSDASPGHLPARACLFGTLLPPVPIHALISESQQLQLSAQKKPMYGGKHRLPRGELFFHGGLALPL